MHVGSARLNARRSLSARAGYSCGLALLVFLFGSKALQNAVAEGDTRTISMHHVHTGEDITVTYKRDGRYDAAALAKLNWFLRDWRRGEETSMDPRLIDLVWEVQRESDTNEPIQIVCGYRSPETNAMLRRHSEGVAQFSQHILGRAIDFYIPGIPLSQLRVIGLRLQRGGVGFYPTSGSPFVHMDVAGIRMWPRMTREQLVNVFPDGRTVQIPTDGKPLPGYAADLADVIKRGAMPSANSLEAARNAGINVDTLLASNERPAANPFFKQLTLAKDDADEDADQIATPAVASGGAQPKPVVLAGLDPSAARKPMPASTAAAKIASAIAKLPVVHIAKLLTAPAPAPVPAPAHPTATRALTPSQIIVARGYWQGPPDATANPLAAVGHFGDVADAESPVSGSIGAPDVALAYADRAGGDAAAAAPAGMAGMPRRGARGPRGGPGRYDDRRETRRQSARLHGHDREHVGDDRDQVRRAFRKSMAARHGAVAERAPLPHHCGARRPPTSRWLASLMIKPHNSVMMTFAADPNPGLAEDRFSGAAIVFVSTVSYPTHTAALQ